MNQPGKPGRPQVPAAPDGPARVMKGGDWGAVAEAALRGFRMESISVPGRPGPKPSAEQSRAAQLEKDLQRAEAAHKAALAKARSDAETEIRAAQARGREEGLSEGEAKAGDRYRRSLEELRRNADVALDLLSREKASLFLEFEGQALELVSAVIHRVFEGFAQRESEAVLPLLRKAVAALGQSNAITLKVNPADFKTASDNQDFWLPVETARKDVRVLADERIPPGGCFVESDSTSVGLRADELAERVDEELKRVFAAKAQALRNESGEGMGPGDGPDAGAGDDAMPGPPAGG